MPIYDDIVAGIDQYRTTNNSLENYLESLQQVVRMLRTAYRKSTIHVDYHLEPVQSGYLITYLPHYYQLIEKILREQNPDSLSKSTEVNITFIGGGPGSEAFGAIKHILFHNKVVETINVTILDINADTWNYSHKIVRNKLIEKELGDREVEINWRAIQFDLTEPTNVVDQNTVLSSSHLVVLQNCINEIADAKFGALSTSVCSIFDALPSQGALLMIDLTSTVREKIRNLQHSVEQLNDVYASLGTTSDYRPTQVASINAYPNSMVRRHLLNGSDGLIPRKNLKYDYSLISKCLIRDQQDQSEAGLDSLYAPLAQAGLSNVDEIKNRTFVGLDIGTSITVCTIATVVDDKIELTTIPFEQKGVNGAIERSHLVPTALGVYRQCFMLGTYALSLRPMMEPDKNTWFGFKTHLGQLEEIVYPNSVLANNSKARIRNAKEGLEVFLSRILDQIRTFVTEKGLPEHLHFSVSVPVSFPDYKKDELRSCLVNSGYNIENTPFTQEPISALIYALFNEDVAFHREEVKNILVLDLGAGTADVSVMKLSADTDNAHAEILSSIRIEERGGDQIDQLIFDASCSGINMSNNSKAIAMHECRNLKVKLCKEVILGTDLILPHKAQDANASSYLDLGIPELAKLRISFEQFHTIMQNYWTGIDETLANALAEAELTAEDIHDVILSGGGARNPYIKAFSRDYFKNASIIVPDNIQEQVARGNALQSLVLNGLGKNLINSKLPHNIYITTQEGEQILFEKGEITPSIDVELDATCVLDGFITIRIENHDKRIRYQTEGTIEKAIFYLSSDQEINCEILHSNSLYSPKKTYIG